jgi:hypothetical protein
MFTFGGNVDRSGGNAMKMFSWKRKAQAGPDAAADAAPSAVDRRQVVLGAGVAGAAAMAASAWPTGMPTGPSAPVPTLADTAAGYRLSPHVLRYYESTKA